MELDLFAKVPHTVWDKTNCDIVLPWAMSRDVLYSQDSIKISF
jgi:hypothetical protein